VRVLGPNEGLLLVRIARASIEDALGLPAPLGRLVEEALERPRLREPRAAFVTLRAEAELRGCIGSFEPEAPLARAVVESAVAAALRDPRFPPVEAVELSAVSVEVSALTPMSPVASAEAIVAGRHGVQLALAGRRALFLPQVAVEQGWDVPTLLEQLALKAGLRASDWTRAALAVFEAESFGERDPAVHGYTPSPPHPRDD
jgi:AmmeMemoRadiSam system protein A